MKLYALACLLLGLFVTLAQSAKIRPDRLHVQTDSNDITPQSEINYLVTLTRTATNGIKDNVLAALMEKGAVVKQVYDYRVYKGILFSVADTADKGLQGWQSILGGIEGVKAVEEDTIVKANA